MRDDGIGGTGRTVFDIAIVDEAGHATFAETVVPLCSAKKVILIGDDKQLPPMLGEDLDCRRDMDSRCDSCAVGADGRQCWYEYSMFQYLWENDKAFKLPRLMLDTQFRMHPDIADFISETFYDGRLKNGVSAEDRKFSFGSFRDSVCLLSTSSQSNRFEVWRGTSYANPLEVELVRGVVEELASSLEDGSAVGGAGRPLSLAVITPYAAQEALLKMKLSHCYRSSERFEFSAEDIASVDRFQGDERDVVIASFVRSPRQNLKGGRRTPKLTFVHDLKRMNVAFSRARRMLIMVGDIKALESAPGNERGRAAFAKFHEHVDKRGRQILVWERRSR
jgi:superfamily I DNA and/or RNA helicase